MIIVPYLENPRDGVFCYNKNMSLYTGKGDDGTTKTFGCDQRISKSSNIAEALGAMDEINSFLGLLKVKTKGLEKFIILGKTYDAIIHEVQKNLFIIQAELAGADKTLEEYKLHECESYINEAEKILPPITTFFISGGTEITALCDISRTVVRRAERRVVAVHDENIKMVGKFSLAYMNRLSSLFYVMARLANHYSGVAEEAPDYK